MATWELFLEELKMMVAIQTLNMIFQKHGAALKPDSGAQMLPAVLWSCTMTSGLLTAYRGDHAQVSQGDGE